MQHGAPIFLYLFLLVTSYCSGRFPFKPADQCPSPLSPPRRGMGPRRGGLVPLPQALGVLGDASRAGGGVGGRVGKRFETGR